MRDFTLEFDSLHVSELTICHIKSLSSFDLSPCVRKCNCPWASFTSSLSIAHTGWDHVKFKAGYNTEYWRHEWSMNDCLRANELLVIENLIANWKDTNHTIPKPAHTPFNDITRSKMLPVYLFYNIPPSQYPTCPYVGNQWSYVSNANMKGAFSGALSISMIIQWEQKWIKNKNELQTKLN